MTLARRDFLAGSAAAVAGFSLAGAGRQEADAPRSGLVTGKPKALRHAEIAGFLSKEQLRWHHDSHYGGALKGFVALDADPTREHRSRIAKANSVLLHELYFDNMTAAAVDPGRATQDQLAKRFGGIDRWIDDFRAAAKACQGWAVLAWHPVNGRLYNVGSDTHDDGPVWSGVPLVVIDVYEHAYYLDFQNRKGDYVDAFTGHVDWNEVERRVRACLG